MPGHPGAICQHCRKVAWAVGQRAPPGHRLVEADGSLRAAAACTSRRRRGERRGLHSAGAAARRPPRAAQRASAASERHGQRSGGGTGRSTTRTRRGPASPPACRPPGPLSTAWTAHLDGAVYGQPLVVGDDGDRRDGERQHLRAQPQRPGKVTWRTHVGTPVPRVGAARAATSIPLGITGTPVYDAGNGLVYAVAEITGYHHMLVGLGGGHAAPSSCSRDLTPDAGQPARLQPAAARAGHRRRAGVRRVRRAVRRLRAYQGCVVSAPLTGNGPLASWHTPTSREGAIWGTAGPVTGPDGNLWVVDRERRGRVTGAVRRQRLGDRAQPRPRSASSFFAPATWAADNASDLDLGSTQPVLAAGGATFIMGKRGVGYLLNAREPRRHRRPASPARPSATRSGAAAVSGATVYEPCSAAAWPPSRSARRQQDDQGAVARPGRRATAHRSSAAARSGSPATPTAAARCTSSTRPPAPSSSQIAIGDGLPHFSSLSLGGGTAYVGTLDGVTAVNGA